MIDLPFKLRKEEVYEPSELFEFYEGFDFTKVDKANGETLNRLVHESYYNDKCLADAVNSVSDYVDDTFVTLATDQTIEGKKAFTKEVSLDCANALRMRQGSYGTLLRNDGTNTYLLVTSEDDVDGLWTSQRPLVVDNATGICDINGSATKLATKRSLWGNDFDGTEGVGNTITFNTNSMIDSFVGTRGIMGGKSNDAWRVGGITLDEDTSELELATADNGNEPIVARQYLYTLDESYAPNGNFDINRVFSGIQKYREAYLLDENGDTRFPGTLYASRFSGVYFRGMIILWYGDINAIPEGWALCNGQNGTPNLVNKFVMGSDSSNHRTEGGTNSQTLSVANLPSHNHSASSSSGGSHTHGASSSANGSHTHTRGSMNITGAFNLEALWGGVTGPGVASGAFYPQGSSRRHLASGTDPGNYDIYFDASRSWGGETSSSGNHTHSISVNSSGNHTHTITVNNTGSGSAFENRPSYMALCYIMRIID